MRAQKTKLHFFAMSGALILAVAACGGTDDASSDYTVSAQNIWARTNSRSAVPGVTRVSLAMSNAFIV